MTSSVSKININFKNSRQKQELKCESKKTSCLQELVGTINQITYHLNGNAHYTWKKHGTYLETSINSGIATNPRKEFKKGDIAFLPASGRQSAFFFANSEPGKRNDSLIGKITSDVA